MVGGILAFLIRSLFGLMIIALVARLLARLGRADYFNPLAQTIATLTNPLVGPLQRLLPSYRHFDVAALVLTWLLQLLMALILVAIATGGNIAGAFMPLFTWSFLALAGIILEVLRWTMLIVVVGSWLTMGSYNPMLAFLTQMVEPFVGPFRKLNLQIGMLDLSFLLAFLALTILKNFILVSLAQQLGYPGGIFIGL